MLNCLTFIKYHRSNTPSSVVISKNHVEGFYTSLNCIGIRSPFGSEIFWYDENITKVSYIDRLLKILIDEIQKWIIAESEARRELINNDHDHLARSTSYLNISELAEELHQKLLDEIGGDA
ncbi:hypothetical protein [Methanoplanus limicola]|uniref:hypothetical protein n=1 Tax=Methanoplanus limicola TaxID=2315 RepID=UPI00064F529A|nr:hypothetical protein [Methanoplanus limicola]